MANIFTNAPAVLDFEEGDLSDYDALSTKGTGSNAASNARSHGGDWSHNAVITSGQTGDRALGRKSITWPGGDVVYFRFFLNIDDLGVATFTWGGVLAGLTVADNVSTSNCYCCMHVQCSTTQVVICARDGSTYLWTDLTAVLNRDQWYEIEVKYDLSGTNAAVEWWLDGESQGTWQGDGLPGDNPSRLLNGFGAYNWDSDVWGDVYHDDIQCENCRIGGEAAPRRIFITHA